MDTINQRAAVHQQCDDYKGKYLDQTLDTDFGPVKARIWDRGVDVSDLEALWWRESECAITSAENGAGTGASEEADAA